MYPKSKYSHTPSKTHPWKNHSRPPKRLCKTPGCHKYCNNGYDVCVGCGGLRSSFADNQRKRYEGARNQTSTITPTTITATSFVDLSPLENKPQTTTANIIRCEGKIDIDATLKEFADKLHILNKAEHNAH